MQSVHSDSIKKVHDVPMHVIRRPIQSILDEAKVESLMGTIEVSNIEACAAMSRPANNKQTDPEKVPPIDVLHIVGSEGGNYYFAFGGCHRWAAHTRLGKPAIKAKLVPASLSTLRAHMVRINQHARVYIETSSLLQGSSCPKELK